MLRGKSCCPQPYSIDFLFPATTKPDKQWRALQKNKGLLNDGGARAHGEERGQHPRPEFPMEKQTSVESSGTLWHLLSGFDDWLFNWVSVVIKWGVWGKSNFPNGSVKSFSLMKGFFWSRDNNLLLDFMPNIDSLCIFYRSPDEIQLIVFCWTVRLSF